jgi:hypothetical protein
VQVVAQQREGHTALLERPLDGQMPQVVRHVRVDDAGVGDVGCESRDRGGDPPRARSRRTEWSSSSTSTVMRSRCREAAVRASRIAAPMAFRRWGWRIARSS